MEYAVKTKSLINDITATVVPTAAYSFQASPERLDKPVPFGAFGGMLCVGQKPTYAVSLVKGPQHSTKRHKVRRDRGPLSGGRLNGECNMRGFSKTNDIPWAGALLARRMGRTRANHAPKAERNVSAMPSGHSPFKRPQSGQTFALKPPSPVLSGMIPSRRKRANLI